MVVLYLNGLLQLDDNSNHLRTKFELSDTMNFSNIIASSDSDKNRYAVLFNVDVDPSVKYYGRAQALLTTGWTKHANLDVVDVRLSGLTGYQNSVLPSKLATPIIGTNGVQGNHTISNFTIIADGFERVGTSTHNSTIYFITDRDNNIIWYRVTDIQLNSINVDDLILSEGEAYKINVIFGSSSNDFSQVASMTIVTGGNDNLFLIGNRTLLIGDDFTVHFMMVTGLTNINIEIYECGETVKLIHMENIIGNKGTLSRNIFESGKLYLMKAKSNLDTVFKNEMLQVS